LIKLISIMSSSIIQVLAYVALSKFMQNSLHYFFFFYSFHIARSINDRKGYSFVEKKSEYIYIHEFT